MKPSVQDMNPKTRQVQISENYSRKIMKYLFLVGGSLLLGLGFLLVLGTMLAGGLPE